MNTHRFAYGVIGIIVAVAFAASLLKIQLAQALIDASSTDTSTSSETTSPDTSAPSSSTSTTDGASTNEAASTESPAASSTTTDTTGLDAPAEPTPSRVSPLALTLVQIVGTKYVDYCTDGSKVISQPGDPEIDSHFNLPDAPTPKCPEGMTWDHTSGMDAYDTPSGDLDVGQYALQSDGSYVAHYPPMRYTSATSTGDWPARISVVSGDPTATSYSGDVTLLAQ